MKVVENGQLVRLDDTVYDQHTAARARSFSHAEIDEVLHSEHVIVNDGEAPQAGQHLNDTDRRTSLNGSVSIGGLLVLQCSDC